MMQATSHGKPQRLESPFPPVAELLDKLQKCGAVEFERLCSALGQRLPRLAKADALLLAEALVLALHRHLGSSNDDAVLTLLDEVGGSWDNTKVLQHDTLRSLLRVVLRGSKRGLHAADTDESTVRRSRSSPDILKRSVSRSTNKFADAAMESAKRLTTQGTPVEELDDEVLTGDLRLVRVLLRLIGHGERDSRESDFKTMLSEEEPLTAETGGTQLDGHSEQQQHLWRQQQQQQQQRRLLSCVLDDGGASPNSPFGDSFGPRPSTPAARAARPASALGTTTTPSAESPQAAEFHYMAEGDSSGLSRCPSEDSIDWCCGLDPDAPVADLSVFHTGDARQKALACSASGRIPRSRSLPAGLYTAVARADDFRECRGAMVLTEAHDSAIQSRELVAQQLMLRQCLDSQDSLRTECAQIRQSQLVVLNSVQETTQMVTEMHGALAEERAARQAERRERAALREDLRTVSSQMGILAQGQLEMQRALAAFCAREAELASATPASAEAVAAAASATEPPPVCGCGEDRPPASASSDRAPMQPSSTDPRPRKATGERRKSCEERFGEASSTHGAEGSRRSSHRGLQHRNTVQVVQPYQQPGIQRQLRRNSHSTKPVGQGVKLSTRHSYSESTQASEERSVDAFLW